MDHLERGVSTNKSLLAHACLLAQEFEAARQLAAAERMLGWSSSTSRGLVMAFFLALLSGSTPSTLLPNLAQHWQWGLDYSTNRWYDVEKDPVRVRRVRLCRAVRHGILERWPAGQRAVLVPGRGPAPGRRHRGRPAPEKLRQSRRIGGGLRRGAAAARGWKSSQIVGTDQCALPGQISTNTPIGLSSQIIKG